MCTGKRQTHIRNAPSSRTAVTGINPYNGFKNSVGSIELLQISRERSKKTASVFLVASRRSGGKSKSLRARFLFATFSFGEAKEKVEPQPLICRSRSAFLQVHSLRHRPKNILPSRRFGTRAYLLRGATQIRKRLDTSLLRKGCGLRGPDDFGAVRLIRLLGGCPSRCCCKGLSASWPSLWAGRKPVLLPRRRKNQNYRIVFLFFIIMRQSRSPRCNPRISISAEARFVAHGTLDESHRRSVRMMR